MQIIKADGTREEFDENKVLGSIKRAKIPPNLHYETLQRIKKRLYDGISTGEIYRHILESFDSEEPYVKARYSLKEAIMMLGPTGYPFEDFVAKVFQAQGYSTRVRQLINGKCVTHEIDVLAEKNGRTAMIEAKFHNSQGTKSEIHVALYTEARFQDIRERNGIDEAWIVTNTKTTVDANVYASCMGLKILSWNYPEGEGLSDIIVRDNLYPITVLTTLSRNQKMVLLENHVVLCEDIVRDPTILHAISLSKEDREKALAEAKFVCQIN